MQLLENLSLRGYNTFGIGVLARYYGTFNSKDQLRECLDLPPASAHLPLILGGGSNILFTRDVDGLVLKTEIRGIAQLTADDEYVYLKVGGGENWHQFVMHCIRNNLGGVENLSLIPGNVGATPMQNIGAYGVELKDIFHELEAFHLNEKRVVKFGVTDCAFGYRESIFKTKYKHQFVILTVTYRLLKSPRFTTSYGAIEQELEKMGVRELSISAISEAVMNIRRSKLPDPAVTGNAGSFFKNPVIHAAKFLHLKHLFPGIVGYSQENGDVKLAAGWLIEQCGWKGYRRGDAGCHPRQALVLVNYGNAKGYEVFNLSEEILQSVKAKFDVELEREVNII